jgi:hypothetical protein
MAVSLRLFAATSDLRFASATFFVCPNGDLLGSQDFLHKLCGR